MSRRPDADNSKNCLLALTMPKHLIIDDIIQEQKQAAELQGKFTIETNSDWSIKDGVHLYKGKNCIPINFTLKTTILREFLALLKVAMMDSRKPI